METLTQSHNFPHAVCGALGISGIVGPQSKVTGPTTQMRYFEEDKCDGCMFSASSNLCFFKNRLEMQLSGIFV
jgi:hypothetical protein